MADITNPEAIKFCNEYLRPISEQVRKLKAQIDDLLIKWNSGVGTIIGTSVDDNIDDGRDAEGISRLTAADVVAVGLQLIAIQTQLDVTGVMEKITLPCVRPLQAT